MDCLLLMVGIFWLFSTILQEADTFNYEQYLHREIRKSQGKLIPLMPVDFDEYKKCEDEICENVTRYPGEKIRHAIMEDKFNITIVTGKILSTPADTENKESKTYAEILPLCKVKEQTTKKPQVMKNVKGEYKFIANVNSTYQQYFNVEICDTSGEANRYPCINHKLECKQKKQDLALLTFENGILAFDIFTIPIICSCGCK